MDEEDLVMSMPDIPQVQIVGALIALSKAVDESRSSDTREHLVKAMECLVYQINPKRGGDVVEVIKR